MVEQGHHQNNGQHLANRQRQPVLKINKSYQATSLFFHNSSFVQHFSSVKSFFCATKYVSKSLFSVKTLYADP